LSSRLQNLSARADARRGLNRDLTRYTTYCLDAYIEHLHDSPVLARPITKSLMEITL
jgi:hypothetical protein